MIKSPTELITKDPKVSLIENVKSHPELYKHDDPRFSSLTRAERNALWDQIAKRAGLAKTEDAKIKWRTLVMYLRQHLDNVAIRKTRRYVPNTGNPEDKYVHLSDWVYYKHMQFMEPYLKTNIVPASINKRKTVSPAARSAVATTTNTTTTTTTTATIQTITPAASIVSPINILNIPLNLGQGPMATPAMTAGGNAEVKPKTTTIITPTPAANTKHMNLIMTPIQQQQQQQPQQRKSPLREPSISDVNAKAGAKPNDAIPSMPSTKCNKVPVKVKIGNVVVQIAVDPKQLPKHMRVKNLSDEGNVAGALADDRIKLGETNDFNGDGDVTTGPSTNSIVDFKLENLSPTEQNMWRYFHTAYLAVADMPKFHQERVKHKLLMCVQSRLKSYKRKHE